MSKEIIKNLTKAIVQNPSIDKVAIIDDSIPTISVEQLLSLVQGGTPNGAKPD